MVGIAPALAGIHLRNAPLVPTQVSCDVVLQLTFGEPSLNLLVDVGTVGNALTFIRSLVLHGYLRVTTGLTGAPSLWIVTHKFGDYPLLLPVKVEQELPRLRPRCWRTGA